MATIKYKYTSIKDMTDVDNYNFYGVIYDATFPTTDDTPNDYFCIIKVIDTETNCLTIPSNIDEEVLTLVIKSNSKDNLPFIHTVGDIIRVHRGLFVKKN